MASLAAPRLPGNATAAGANEAFPDLCLHEEQEQEHQRQGQQERGSQNTLPYHQFSQPDENGQIDHLDSIDTDYHNYPNHQHHDQHYQHYQVPLAQQAPSVPPKPADIVNRPSSVSLVSAVSSFSAASFSTDSVVPVHVVDASYADAGFDSRRASVISAASSLSSLSSSSSPPLPSTATLPSTSTPSTPQQQRPLTRSRRDAKQLHAARVQRSASVALGDPNSSPSSKETRKDTNGGREATDWDWTSRRAGSTSPSPDENQKQQQQQQQGGGLTRMAYAEQQRWIKVQEKTFTKWLNTKLQERDLEVKDLVADLSDGVMLIHLLECLSSESLGRYAAKPKLRVQRFENANLSLNFIKSRGIQMTNIGAEDVVDGNRKIILGLIWTLILRFTISDIHEEGMTAKEGLLLWCQRKTACYDEVDVRDFSASWNDGLAFCALLDIHRPDLIDYDALDKNDRRGNMQLAFDLAHREIGIPKLLDVEDVCDVAKPDDRSLMTYIAYWFHAFSQMEKVENAGRRVEKFVNNMQGAWEMQSAYERRVAELLRQVRAQVGDWRAATFAGTYADAKAQAAAFASYKRGQKRQWVAEKSELATLLGNIKTKLGTYRLRPYDPPAELRLEVMDREWAALTTSEMNRGQLINETIRDIKNNLRKSFADKANDFALALNTVQLAISGLEGDVEDQLHHVRKLSGNLPPLEKYLATIEAVDAQCEEANIEENDFTTYTYDELTYELGLVKASVSKKLVFLENQMVARSMTNLTPIQLEEFESVFRHFDRDDSNALQELEFSAALASLGLVFSEDEMHEYFVDAASSTTGNGSITIHKDRVSFEQFIRFMVDVTEDQNTAEQVFQSFREVADGKPYVTEMDLRHSLVPDEVIDKLVTMMPKHAGPDLAEDRGTPQYDYITFMDKMMGDLEPSSSQSQSQSQSQQQQPASATPSQASTFSSASSQQHQQQQYKHNSASSSMSSSSSYSLPPAGSQSPRKLPNGY